MASPASGSPKLPQNNEANTVKNVQSAGGRNIGPSSDKNGNVSNMVPKPDARVSGRKTI